MSSEDSQKSGVKKRQGNQKRQEESEEGRQVLEEIHRKKEGEEMTEALNVVVEMAIVEVTMPKEQERLQRKKQMVNRAEQLLASISRRRAEVGRLMMMMMTMMMTVIIITLFVQLEALVEGAAGKSNNWETLHRWVLSE